MIIVLALAVYGIVLPAMVAVCCVVETFSTGSTPSSSGGFERAFWAPGVSWRPGGPGCGGCAAASAAGPRAKQQRTVGISRARVRIGQGSFGCGGMALADRAARLSRAAAVRGRSLLGSTIVQKRR